jgi:hypothetical protein
VALDRGRHRPLRFGGTTGRPQTLRRSALARAGDAGRLGGKTLKVSIQGQREGRDAETMSGLGVGAGVHNPGGRIPWER